LITATYKDELGTAFELFLNSQLQDQVLPTQINNENSVWWDDIVTKNKKETRQEIIQQSFA
jgi:penicillin amidase